MPTHWESSKRPLFVRTVFVNGNRHAILSQEDPLSQSNAAPSSRKQSRPSSCQSFASTFSVNSLGSQDSNLGRRFRNFKTDNNNNNNSNNQWEQENRVNQSNNKEDISSELQGCLVKLRLVLATHENKNKYKNERLFKVNQDDRKSNQSNSSSRQKENVKQKRKKSNHSKMNKKKSCDYYYYHPQHHSTKNEALKETDLKGYKEDNNYYLFNKENENENYYYLETTSKISSSSLNTCCEKDANLIEIRDICCFEGYHETRKLSESILSRTSTTITSFVEKVERNHGNPPSQFFPTIQLPSNDISWNSLSSDSYFTRPFYNPLSERVLQWLDLASKRKESNAKNEKLHEEISTDNIERIFEGSTFLDENNIARYRDKSKAKNNKILRSKSEGKTNKTTNYERKEKKRGFFRQSTEKRSDSKESDAEDEVRQENDIETALSNQIIPQDYPKYSKELNKLHKSMSQQDKCEESSETSSEGEKISTATDSTSSGIVVSAKIDSESSTSSIVMMPEKLRDESSVSMNLKESIMNNFNDVATYKPSKSESDKNKPEQSNYSFTTYQYFPQAKPKAYQTTEERRGQLIRQAKLQETSDEEDDSSLKTRKIDCWNKTTISVKQRRNAFSHRNSMFNKTIDCNNNRTRRDALKRQKNRTPSLQQKDKDDDDDSSPSENQSIIQAIFHHNPLPPQLQNKIPWLRDYQSGGKNMWPSDKGTNKPQLHIFMPAIPPKIKESGTGEESVSDCDSLTSEVCPCNGNYKVPEEA